MTQFALSGLVAVVAVGAAGVLVLNRTAVREGIRDARSVTRLLAATTIAPNLRDGLLTGRRSAIARFDARVRGRALGGDVRRVKLWTPDGRIVYSDEQRLIGARYPLGADELSSLRSGRIAAEVSDLTRPENRYERAQGKLLEVYMPVRTPSGRPLLFETYQRYGSIAADARRMLLTFAPALLAALVLLWALQIPLARALARRLREGQREREALLLKAMDASDAERRRIAADLHDGVVQRLAGVAYGLEADAVRATARPDGAEAGRLRGRARDTRESIRELRSLLVELHPPNLHASGLRAAIADLAAPLRARGIEPALELAEEHQLSPPAEEFVFRAAQEGLRNVLKHANASRVTVRLVQERERAVLTIADDGRGFTPGEVERRRAGGHLGLALLRDRARDVDARVDVDSEPGRGTCVRVEVATA